MIGKSGRPARGPGGRSRAGSASGRGRAAPLVGAVVGARGQELVDQVALGAHDLDRVVARLPGEPTDAGEVARRLVDALGRQGGRSKGRDRRLLRRGADAERVVAVAAGVQHLHRDRAALVVHRAGDLAVPHRLQPDGHLRGERLEPAALVGRVAAGHDQADATAGALGEVRRQPGDVARPVLEAGVHRAHHDPVAQLERAEGDRRQQVGVVHEWASRYSVSQSTQNSSRRMPPRSTRYWSSSSPARSPGSG